jgi:hypothetical protein
VARACGGADGFPHPHEIVCLSGALGGDGDVREVAAVMESGRALKGAPGVAQARAEGGAVIGEIGAGEYRFGYAMVK